MRPNPQLLMLVAVALVLTLAPVALAQTDYGDSPSAAAPAAEGLRVTGTVVTTSPTMLVIRTESGKTMTFTLDQSSSAPTGLRGGDLVEVAYVSAATGGYLASHVATVSAPAPTSAGTSDLTSTPSQPDPANPGSATGMSDASATETEAELPRTAGSGAAIGMIGAALLAAGVVLWQVRRSRPRSARGAHVR